MKATYYKWLAESIVMTDSQTTQDILAALDHACSVPGNITPAQADRLRKFALAIQAVLNPVAA